MGKKTSPIIMGEPDDLKIVADWRGTLVGMLESKVASAGASKMNLFTSADLAALILVSFEA
jgi:hypothetical protein